MRRLVPLLAALALAAGGCATSDRSAAIAAADGGDMEAQVAAGEAYYWGLGVTGDIDTAERYWTMAADQGSEQAADYLAQLAAGRPLAWHPDGGTGRRLFGSLFGGDDDEMM